MSVIVFYNSSHSHTYICYVLHIKIYLHISEVCICFQFFGSGNAYKSRNKRLKRLIKNSQHLDKKYSTNLLFISLDGDSYNRKTEIS